MHIQEATLQNADEKQRHHAVRRSESARSFAHEERCSSFRVRLQLKEASRQPRYRQSVRQPNPGYGRVRVEELPEYEGIQKREDRNPKQTLLGVQWRQVEDV